MILINPQSFESTTLCKICGNISELSGVVDFNKFHNNPGKLPLPVSGKPIYYHQCKQCKFLFTVALDKWSKQDFIDYIYNEYYIEIDPSYATERPDYNAELVAAFCKENTALSILDYGGGNGRFSQQLCSMGFNSISWDPMNSNVKRPINYQVDIVTAFEVLEHTPTPLDTFNDAISFLKPDGIFLFSTMTLDTEADQSVQNWYVTPRGGHVSIFTKLSLKILADNYNIKLLHLTEDLHFAYRMAPSWMANLSNDLSHF